MARRSDRPQDTENVRMGPIAIFALIAVLSLATLAVLAASTAHATLSLSQRRAVATTQLYLQEEAAQTFVATLDAGLAQGMPDKEAIAAACDAAGSVSASTETPITVSASGTHPNYTASFDCGNGRLLNIALHYTTDGALSIDQWRMTSVVNEEPTLGNLLGSS